MRLAFALLLLHFIVPTSFAQQREFPVELKGFEFFGEGKLRGLQLGVSRKEDVKRIFGTTCEQFCDYDAEWKIEFWYFDEKAYIETYYTKGEDGKRLDYKYFVPDPNYIGTIRSIEINPKKSIPFRQKRFPSRFERMPDNSVSGEKSDGSWEHVNYSAIADRRGLRYEFWNDKTHKKIDYLGNLRKDGDLISIEYTIPDDLEKKMFVQTTKKN